MKKILLTVILLTYSVSLIAFAKDWDLPGIDLITREERGADETRRYEEQPRYQSILNYQKKEAEDLQKLKDTNYEAYKNKTRAAYESKMANQHLMEQFGEEFTIDEVNYYHDGHELWTPESIKHDKMKFIIHHTAVDNGEITDKEAAIEELRSIYQFHAFTRGRWDIGYNFEIDPFGNIYEWRAGWEGVVAAHAYFNNSPSIGISLMWNFDVQKPTDEQIESLKKLLVSLAQKYEVDPNARTYYHRKSNTAPYVESNQNYTIAGHTDAGYTSCPWDHLHSLLPDIRRDVRKTLVKSALTSRKSSKTKQLKLRLPWFHFSNSSDIEVSADLWLNGVEKCTSVNADIDECKADNDDVVIEISKNNKFDSGFKTVKIKDKSGREVELKLLVLWQKDLDPIITSIKNKFYKKRPNGSVSNSKKITEKISKSEIRKLMEQKIHVLLRDLSYNYNRWELICDEDCKIVADGKLYDDEFAMVEYHDDILYLTVGDEIIMPKTISVFSQWDWVQVRNYDRKSYAGIERNKFRWMLTWGKDLVKEWYKDVEKLVVVNILDFKDYMKGVAESDDTQHFEKNKVMALISKSYALFYMDKDNIHPSIPEDATYNAIDHPDYFQKYVWAWLEKTLSNWDRALAATEDEVVMYDGYLPILPYFSCSVWFTKTAEEKWWWTDTPYLQSRLDLMKCSDFKWHGVGLSGKWAERWANNGRSYEEILKYYYDGVEIERI